VPHSSEQGVLPRIGLLAPVWIGVAAGLVEIGIRAIQHFVLGRLLFVGVDFWWGAPLVTAFLIGSATLLLISPLTWTGRLPVLRLRYGFPLGLGSLGLFLLVPGLAWYAAVLLATAVAVQGGKWLARRTLGFERLVRRTLAVIMLGPALAGAGLHVARTALPVSFHPKPEAAGVPNVLLLVLDTVRAMELGLYGFKPTTSPKLDGLGAQGVVFDQAFSTAPWTAPSHAGMFTGRPVHELSIDWSFALDGTYPTLAEVLTSAGYATVGIVANTEYASGETGLARGFGHYEDYRLTVVEALRWTGLARAAARLWTAIRHPPPGDLSGRIRAEEVNRRFLRWIDRNAARPFFGFLNFFDAHAPYFPPEPYWSRFLPGEPRRPRMVLPGTWSVPAVTVGRRAYQAAIASLDAQVGALLDSLRVRGVLKNTLVIVVGDHGEEFFEHGLMGHGNSLYAPSVRVPFLLMWPGHLPARLVREPVSLGSLPATIMDLLGRPGPFPGPSLVGYWTGRSPLPVAVTSAVTFARNLPSWYPVSQGGMASARLGRYRYLTSPRDTLGQLYDHETDPLETRNLAGEARLAPILHALRDTVAAVLPRRVRP
jgi:arylsulfatase A-like enzyme